MLRAAKHFSHLATIDTFETVKITEATYEEITRLGDSRNTAFRAKLINKLWESKELTGKKDTPDTVKGFTQKLSRVYDTNTDTFLFSIDRDQKQLKIKDIMEGPSVWNGKALTLEQVFDICDEFIDKVIID